MSAPGNRAGGRRCQGSEVHMVHSRLPRGIAPAWIDQGGRVFLGASRSEAAGESMP